MALKDYYFILGISPDTRREGLRAAFRQLAKKFHPDKAGCDQTAAFQDITEAYEVLSDPEKRKCYNNKLLKEEKKKKDRVPVYKASRKQKNRDTFFASHSSDSSFNRHWESMPREFEKGKADSHVVEMDAYMTSLEACSGTSARFNIGVNATCWLCGGTGSDFIFMCSRCNGSGTTIVEKSVEIDLPPNLTHGSQIKTSIALSREKYLHLLIHVHII